MPKLVKASWAKRYYDIGTEYQGLSIQEAFDRSWVDYGDQIPACWEAQAAFWAGQAGWSWEIKDWRRYGDLPEGSDGYAAPSYNHADQRPESGVSCADDDWEGSLRGLISIARSTRPLVRFRGIQVGYGSDGEPVVLPVED